MAKKATKNTQIEKLITDVDNAGESVKRIAGSGVESAQPRLSDKEYHTYFNQVLGFHDLIHDRVPEYKSDSRKRDQILRAVWREDPFLAGVMDSIVLIDSNRTWVMTGGRNQVRRFATILQESEGGRGWKPLMKKSSLSFRATDMGAVIEVATFPGTNSLGSLFHVDSARCKLVKKGDTTLEYFPAKGNMQSWTDQDYFRITDMESDDEKLLGLGFCGLSRSMEILKLMTALIKHDQEQMGARAPKGLLLLKGIAEHTWKSAFERRKEYLDSLGIKLYGNVLIIGADATMGGDVDAKMVSLSQLPESFQRREFVDTMMYAYALAFGFAPEEFWPVQRGSLGRGKESEIQAIASSTKGVLAFPDELQHALKRWLPNSLSFEFDNRTDEGDLVALETQTKISEMYTSLYEARGEDGEGLITRDEARTILVSNGILPDDFTSEEEDVTITDSSTVVRHQARGMVEIRRAAEMKPDEPIIRYRWPHATETVLWKSGEDMLRQRVWGINRTIERATDEVLYDGDDFEIKKSDVTKALRKARTRVGKDFRSLLVNKPLTEDEEQEVGID